MAHLEKYTASALGHLLAHYERRQIDEEYIKFGNQSIDLERTSSNYNLAPEYNQLEFIKERKAQIKVQNRKDIIQMCTWVVTVPKDLEKNKHEHFFEASYTFLKERYGEANVISSYVHLDETSPHMHFAFMPVAYDKKKERYKLCAKDVITRKELKVFHNELSEYLSKELGQEVNVLNEATKDGNKSISELKIQTANENLARIEEKLAVAEGSLILCNAEYISKRAYIEECNKSSQISKVLPDYVKVSKPLFGKEMITVPKEKWEERFISANEKNSLMRAKNSFENEIESYRSSNGFTALQLKDKKIETLENEIYELKSDINRERSRANKAEKALEKTEKILLGVLEFLSEHFPEVAKHIENFLNRNFLTTKKQKERER